VQGPRDVADDLPLAGLCDDTAVERARRRRLDQILVDRGLVETRARAQALVLAGRVRVGDGDGARRDLKPGDLVADAAPIHVASGPDHASRGGDKLAGALEPLGIDPAGRVCLDVGASTGGFTDVLLRRGAIRVHAVDVGRGQLADRLARDPRVVVHDRTNARALDTASIGETATLATIDVSFISLRLVLGPVAACLAEAGGSIVALVKPQFEAAPSIARLVSLCNHTPTEPSRSVGVVFGTSTPSSGAACTKMRDAAWSAPTPRQERSGTHDETALSRRGSTSSRTLSSSSKWR